MAKAKRKTAVRAQADSRDIELLRSLVEIHSGTPNVAGVNRVQALIDRELETLGFRRSWETHPEGEQASGRLLWGELPGTGKGFITLVCHADTVEPGEGPSTAFRLDAGGTRASGVGTIDDKGGHVVALRG